MRNNERDLVGRECYRTAGVVTQKDKIITKIKRKDNRKEKTSKSLKQTQNKVNLEGCECCRTAGAVTVVFVLFSNSSMFAFQIRGAA